MSKYSLAFFFSNLIAGNGYIANVRLYGRAVLEEDVVNRNVWVYGVQPGGIADGAQYLELALEEFKKGYVSVLFDFASKSDTFDAFRAGVVSFFSEVNEPSLADWHKALREPGVCAPVGTLVMSKANLMLPHLIVEQVDCGLASPELNRVSYFVKAI